MAVILQILIFILGFIIQIFACSAVKPRTYKHDGEKMVLFNLLNLLCLVHSAEAFTKYGPNFLKLIYGVLLLAAIVILGFLIYVLWRCMNRFCGKFKHRLQQQHRPTENIASTNRSGELVDSNGHIIDMRDSPLNVRDIP